VFGRSQQGAEDQDIESALQEFYARGRSAAHYVGILLFIL
jgi:hypothetical protein